VRAPRKKTGRRATATLSARLLSHITLQAQAGGDILARFDDVALGLGKFSAEAAERAKRLHVGLPLSTFASGHRETDKEIQVLVRRLAGRGLIEYRLGRAQSEDIVVIEPQLPDYWPRLAQLGNADTLVLSRFAYMRRRANEMVLESPRAGALLKICDPKIAVGLALLSTPQQIKQFRRQKDFPGLELLALLVDCQILFKIDAGDNGLRPAEGDDALVLWDFHDLVFHARSTEGRHANPLGGAYPYADRIAPLPAVRPPWPGTKIDLCELAATATLSPTAALLRERHSTREFDNQKPITLAELARFLDGTARVQSELKTTLDHGGGGGGGGPELSYTVRPYPSAGASYELELYLAVDTCEGLPRGFYHYDAGSHALVPIEVRGYQLDALLNGATFAMGVNAAPQILIIIAARFGRVSWKYSSIAYALILKDVGALMQTFYVMDTDMGLGGCAIGTTNIELFAKMTGLDFHIEGPVGQFALGRGAKPEASR
jgi:SagB-type dehydrogenase family enzyme